MKIIKLSLIAGLVVLAAQVPVQAEELGAAGAPVSTETAKAKPAAEAKGPPAEIASGYRGTSVPIDGDQLFYLKKGDRVDVLVTFEARVGDEKGERKEMMTASILQNVVVINLVKPEKEGAQGAVELLLNPNEAQYMALSVAQARQINIAVRAPGDVVLHPMEMASFRRLMK